MVLKEQVTRIKECLLEQLEMSLLWFVIHKITILLSKYEDLCLSMNTKCQNCLFGRKEAVSLATMHNR